MSGKETYTPEEMHKALFVNLVMMLATSAMQAMGKLMNPATNKAEVNIEMAQHSIDMLEMLEAKTRNNLDKEEARLLKDTLATLQLNFVETAAAPEPEKTTGAPPPAAPAAPAAAPAPPAPKKDGGDPKYHKTYG